MTIANSEIIAKVLAADGASFTTLVKIANLDPKKDFRRCNLEGIDFAGCNLSGFDFSGSVLCFCTFGGTVLGDVRLVGTRTDPGALEQALDWESYQAREGGKLKYQTFEDGAAPSDIGAFVRKIQTVIGVQGHLRYMAQKGSFDVIAMIAAAANSAPIQEMIDGVIAATGRKIVMSKEGEGDGHLAIAELRAEFHHQVGLIEELRRAADDAPTFALCFCCVSALTWLYQGLQTRQLERSKELLALEGQREFLDEDWDALDLTEPSAAKFDWQLRALKRAIQFDKRRPTDVHLMQLIRLAASEDQLSRVFRFMLERETTITRELAIVIASRTLTHTRQYKTDSEKLRHSIWGNTEGGAVLLKVFGTRRDKVHLRGYDAYQVTVAMHAVAR